MDDKEYGELKSQHAAVFALKQKGARVAAFRNIKFDELAPLFETERNPAAVERDMADACLLWPSADEFAKIVKAGPTVVTSIAGQIRRISGNENLHIDFDEKSSTWTVYRREPDAEDVDPETPKKPRVKLLAGGKLAWPDFLRCREQLKKEKLQARRLACVAAATFPATREERIQVFEDLPYLAETLFLVIYGVSGAGEFDIEGN